MSARAVAGLLAVSSLLAPSGGFAQISATAEPIKDDSAEQAVTPSDDAGFDYPNIAPFLGIGFGIGPLLLRSGLDHVRESNGYDRLAPFAMGVLFEGGVELWRFVVHLGLDILDLDLEDSYGYLGAHASIGYRLTERGPWLVTPFLGYGTYAGTICFEGNPSQRNNPRADSFTQIAQNPGPSTCVRNDRGFVRAALAIDYRLFAPEEEEGGATPGFYLGARAQAAFPVGATEWELSSDDLPEFDGPNAPIAGIMLGLVVGMAIGTDVSPEL